MQLLPYREIADAHGVLQQPLEADGPAGHSPLGVAPVALNAGEAGIAVQTVVAAAALQLHAVEFWSTHTRTITKLDKDEVLFPASPEGATISSIESTCWS